MKSHWLLVANGTKAYLFNHADKNSELNLLKTFDYDVAHGHKSDFKEDRPGRSFDSNPDSKGRHAMEKENDVREQLLSQFSKKISESINKSRSLNEFKELMIAAEPKLLGQLRKDLSPQTDAMITKTFSKDWVQLKAEDIHKNIYS